MTETTISSQNLWSTSQDALSLRQTIVTNLAKEESKNCHLQFRNPLMEKLYCTFMNKIQAKVLMTAEKYHLEPATLCMFDTAFRAYQSRNFKNHILKNGQNIESYRENPEDDIESFDQRLILTEINAFICLRVVMKYAEKQIQHEMTVPSDVLNDPISAYQDILNTIIQKLMIARNSIWGEDFGLQGLQIEEAQKEQIIEKLVNNYIQLKEYEMCISNYWNFNMGSGEEILS